MATISMEALMLHLLHKAENSRTEFNNKKKSMLAEVRTLEFWRAIIAECLASFFYVFLVCGSYVQWPHTAAPTLLTKAFASGLAMAAVAQCFGHVSGAHTNPACTLAMLVTRKITPLRTFLYVTSQCGGAIAGAALLYGVTASSGGTGPAAVACSEVHETLSIWQALSIELSLTFVVVFTVYATSDPNRKTLGSEALAVGTSYLACSLAAQPATGASMNPARSLGPAFVMNYWTNHWVYWCGPVCGGLLAGLIYEYIFDNDKRTIPSLRDEEEDTDKDSRVNEDEDSEPKSTKSIDLHQSRIRLSQLPTQQNFPPAQPLLQQQQQQQQQQQLRFIRNGMRGSIQAVDGFPGQQAPPNSYTYPDFYNSLPRPNHRGWNSSGIAPKF